MEFMRFSRLIVARRTPGLGKDISKMVVFGGRVWNDMMGENNAMLLKEHTMPTG
jgi:hypothetical protein